METGNNILVKIWGYRTLFDPLHKVLINVEVEFSWIRQPVGDTNFRSMPGIYGRGSIPILQYYRMEDDITLPDPSHPLPCPLLI